VNPGSRAPAAAIQDQIPTDINVVIYDVLGRPVKNLHKDRVHSTILTIPWDGTNNSNERLPSGIYFMKVTAGQYTQIQKVMILR
jgi:flagellar hook assembly protein FlgD